VEYPKKMAAIFVAALLMFGPFAYAKDDPFMKLARGIVNLATSPGEYILQTVTLMKDHDPLTAYCGGFLKGTYRTLERIGVGVYDIVTFPVPVPKGYRPVIEPPTVMDALEQWREGLYPEWKMPEEA